MASKFNMAYRDRDRWFGTLACEGINPFYTIPEAVEVAVKLGLPANVVNMYGICLWTSMMPNNDIKKALSLMEVKYEHLRMVRVDLDKQVNELKILNKFLWNKVADLLVCNGEP